MLETRFRKLQLFLNTNCYHNISSSAKMSETVVKSNGFQASFSFGRKNDYQGGQQHGKNKLFVRSTVGRKSRIFPYGEKRTVRDDWWNHCGTAGWNRIW